MKIITFFSMFICSIFIFTITGCDRTELQKALPPVDEKIGSRADDCDDCPVDDCCCEIVLTSGTSLTLEICGSTGANVSVQPCGPINNPPSPCPAIAAGYLLGPFSLTTTTASQIFCVPVNAAFMINATVGNGNVSITCQKGQAPAQTVNTSFSAPNRYFFETDGDCELSSCD